MIGVIADDLTGAAELSGAGFRHGLRSEVVTEPKAISEADLVCVDTDSRSCPPTEAGRRAATAASTLTALRAEWIYKKVDSVLRGRIVAELEAMMNQLRLPRALLVPANPSLGRVVRDEQYFVTGRPIHETDFRLDPEYPRLSSSVLELLGPSASHPVQVRTVHDSLPAAGIVVGEAQTVQDLRQWASRRDGATLMAGAAEFFGALLEAAGHRAISTPALPTVPVLPKAQRSPSAAAEPELFVCGSRSEACRSFVAESRRHGVAVFGLPVEVAGGGKFSAQLRQSLAEKIAEAGRTSPRLVLEIGLPSVKEPRAARQLTEHLAELAREVLLRLPRAQVYAEGGATGASLLRCMNWNRLRVVREIAPGVVTFQIPGDWQCLLTLKPGSYVWPANVKA